MWETFINATSVEQVLALLAKHGQDMRVINGGTDLIFEAEAARLADLRGGAGHT
jgi:CO/xanthine dehydrogenase FAD-binding subunit